MREYQNINKLKETTTTKRDFEKQEIEKLLEEALPKLEYALEKVDTLNEEEHEQELQRISNRLYTIIDTLKNEILDK